MDCGELPGLSFNLEVISIFRRAYIESVTAGLFPLVQRHKTQALLLASDDLALGDYKTLDIENAASNARKICGLIDAIEYKDFRVPKTHDLDIQSPLHWYRLGCVYIKVCEFVAEDPLVSSHRWRVDPLHRQTFPRAFLRRALCCFSQGCCEQESMYAPWFYERWHSRNHDLDRLCVEIGRELQEQANDKLRRGQTASDQAIFQLAKRIRRGSTSSEYKGSKDEVVAFSPTSLLYCACALGLLMSLASYSWNVTVANR
jgi:hypothetical protein